jgi:hypothetical protein
MRDREQFGTTRLDPVALTLAVWLSLVTIVIGVGRLLHDAPQPAEWGAVMASLGIAR